MKKSTQHKLIAGICLPAGLLMLIWFLYALFHASAAIQSGVIAGIGVVTAGIVSHRYATRREIAARHFEKKREAYTGLIDLTFEMLMADKLRKKAPSDQQLLSKIAKFKKDLLTWADADVIETWMEVEASNLDDLSDENPAQGLLVWDKLLRAMRKDLGKDDSKLAEGDLVALFLNTEGKADLKKFLSA